jgi:signal transduction histidine kinase
VSLIAASAVRGTSDLVRRFVGMPMVADILVTAGTAAFALSNDHWGEARRSSAWVFDLALAAPLLWRKRHPLFVFLTISLIALVQWLTNTPSSGPVAVLIALYAVGAYESRRRAILLAAAIAQLGVVMVTLRWAPVGNRVNGFVLLTGTITAAWVMGVYAKMRRAYVTAALERATTAEHERDRESQLATAAERARISREMHDIVAHTLSVMVALSDGAAMSVVRDADAARDAMEQSSTLGRQALSELRRLLGGLQGPEMADLSPAPGVQQLEDLVSAVRTAGLAVDLVVFGQPPVMPPGLQLAVYRLVQEGLTNVLKHAPAATRATVTLKYGPTDVEVQIDNDGVPAVAVVAPTARPGQGVTGMGERAAVFGGTVQAGPRGRGGWRVHGSLSLGDVGADR